MSTVTFKYEIQQSVTIRALDLQGFVRQRCDCGDGLHEYQVVYWSDGARRTEWLLEHEVSA